MEAIKDRMNLYSRGPPMDSDSRYIQLKPYNSVSYIIQGVIWLFTLWTVFVYILHWGGNSSVVSTAQGKSKVKPSFSKQLNCCDLLVWTCNMFLKIATCLNFRKDNRPTRWYGCKVVAPCWCSLKESQNGQVTQILIFFFFMSLTDRRCLLYHYSQNLEDTMMLVASCLEIALENNRKFTWQLMKLSSIEVLSTLRFPVLVARTP